MNIAKYLQDYDLNKVFFLNPIKNTVIDNSNFIRILYSNELFILNGVYLIIDINDISIDKHNNKIKYSFNPEKNLEILNSIKNIEINLLKKINIKNKNMSTKILDQLDTGFLKISNEYNENFTNKFILKISGIWESIYEYGLTYKFINVEYNIEIVND